MLLIAMLVQLLNGTNAPELINDLHTNILDSIKQVRTEEKKGPEN